MPGVPVPISQMPAATLPLTGSEVTVVVQDGLSKKAPSTAFGAIILVLGAEKALVAAAGNNNDAVFGVTFNRLLVDTTAGDANLTGIAAGSNGQICVVTNRGANLLNLMNENVASVAANRLYGVTDITLPARESMLLQYSAILARWVMV